MANVYLLLGSNQGNKDHFLAFARQEISRQIGAIITSSSIYKSAAWGKQDQDDFLNQVLKIQTFRQPKEVLFILQKIEQQAGRKRIEKWGTRTLDIDILFWDDLILNEPDLKIPHPGIPHRKFTLIPLAEITPDFLHPEFQLTIQQLLKSTDDTLKVTKIG